jgi:hypothetical protein
MKTIIPILLGNSNKDLHGVKTDIIIIYNLFYKFHTVSSRWVEPNILMEEMVTIENINNIIYMYKNTDNPIFLIYFTGHSNSKGELKFYNKHYNAKKIINIINKNFNNFCEIYFIIDSCFSKKFIYIKNHSFITKLSYVVSCLNNEKSKDIIMDYDDDLFDHLTIDFACALKQSYNNQKYMIVSIFTYYFVSILKIRGIINIEQFKTIKDDPLWQMITTEYNQTIYYEENP